MKRSRWADGSFIGAIMGAIAASLCCVGPLVLLTLGLGGAWISTLTSLEFLRPIGIVITVFFLVLAFWMLYIAPKHCAIDKSCTTSHALRFQRMVFWVITIVLILLLAFPWYAFLFY